MPQLAAWGNCYASGSKPGRHRNRHRQQRSKGGLAKVAGCYHIVLYSQEDLVEQVRALTTGQGVDVVYDAVGKDTFFASLDCLKPRGTLVSFGAASGPVPPFDIALLGAKDSLHLTRPSLAHYTSDRAELEAGAAAVFALILAVRCHHQLSAAGRATGSYGVGGERNCWEFGVDTIGKSYSALTICGECSVLLLVSNGWSREVTDQEVCL